MLYPFSNDYPVTSPFGRRLKPDGSGAYEFHGSVDFGCPEGTPILASTSGTVTLSTYNESLFGNYIELTESAEIMTRYCHLSRRLVEKGTRVIEGQVIGYSGNTGYSFGAHLDFSVFLRGAPVDPFLFLNNKTFMSVDKNVLFTAIENNPAFDEPTKICFKNAIIGDDWLYIIGDDATIRTDLHNKMVELENLRLEHKINTPVNDTSLAPTPTSVDKSPLMSKKVWVAFAGIIGYVAVKYFGADEVVVTDFSTRAVQLLSELGILTIPTTYIAVQGSIDRQK